MNKFTKQLQKGFTLIELLIVIAVLGVLAAVILVAIDPIDQIARAEDAGRKSTVSQLAAAWQAYLVGQALTTAPAAVATWQDTLQTGGEIKSVFTAPAGSATCAPAANNDNNYCYAPNGATGNYFVWTFLESKSEIDKAAGAAAQICTAPAQAAYLYDSAQGKGGNACISISAVPGAGITLY